MGNFPRLSRGLGVIAMLCLAAGARADDVTYMSQAEDANARLHLLGPHLSDSDKSSFAQTVADLKGKAAELDQLKPQIDAKMQDAITAKADYDTANSSATALRQQADQANQEGRANAEPIMQEANGLCGQMSGRIDGDKCMFTCPQDQPALCSQQVASYESRIAQLKSQAEAIIQNVQDAEQKAQAAAAEANQKQQALQEAQQAVDDLNNQLKSKSDAFEQELQTFNDDLKKAEKPLNLHLGPAYNQAVATNDNMQKVAGGLVRSDQTCYDTKCFDIGANSDGTLVVASVPDVPASVPAAKASQLQTEMQSLTKQYNDVHDRLRQAEANRDPGVGDLVRQLSAIQGQVEMTAFRIKSYHIDMTQVAAPAH